jgi:RNA pseudouridylate synthase
MGCQMKSVALIYVTCIGCYAWVPAPMPQLARQPQAVHAVQPTSLQRCSRPSTRLHIRPQWRYGIELDEEAAEVAAVAAAKLDSEDDTSDYESAVFVVEDAEKGDRIDKFLAGRLPEQSRTYYGSLCAESCVIVDGSCVKKAHKVVPGQSVEVRFAPTPELNLAPQNIPLHILYEDADIIAIAKPPGMVVHPAPGNWDGTFVNALLYHLQQSGNSVDLSATKAGSSDAARPGVVHRLDKGTSGVLLAAKNPTMQVCV